MEKFDIKIRGEGEGQFIIPETLRLKIEYIGETPFEALEFIRGLPFELSFGDETKSNQSTKKKKRNRKKYIKHT